MLQPEEVIRALEKHGLEYKLAEPGKASQTRKLHQVAIPSVEVARIAIAVPDHTRPLPLTEVLEVLNPLISERSLLMFATGTHPMPLHEAYRLLGSWADKLKFKIHDCRGPHTLVGVTARGLPVEVDEDFASSDFKVTVGVVAPHPWAGFSGGGKVVLPGLSSLRTVVDHHLKWYKAGRPGQIEGNTFRDEVDNALRLAGVDWSLNVVLDEKGEVVFADGGDPMSSFLSCVKVAERLYVRDIDGFFDSAVLFADPLDTDLYQATKALELSAHAVVEGGRILLVASCRLGYGSKEFEYFMKMDRDDIVKKIEEGDVGNLVPAIVAINLKEIAESRNIALFSEFNFKELNEIATIKDPLEAVGVLKGRVLVVKRGGFTVARVSR